MLLTFCELSATLKYKSLVFAHAYKSHEIEREGENRAREVIGKFQLTESERHKYSDRLVGGLKLIGCDF